MMQPHQTCRRCRFSAPVALSNSLAPLVPHGTEAQVRERRLEPPVAWMTCAKPVTAPSRNWRFDLVPSDYWCGEWKGQEMGSSDA